MNRCRAVGLLLACAGMVGAQGVEQPVTYRTVAVQAFKAVGDISKLTHQPIRVDPPLDTQPLILELDNVPLKQALDKICVVLHAIWRTDDKGIDIVRPTDLQQKLEDDRNAKDVASLAAGMKDVSAAYLAHPITKDSVERMLEALKKLNLSDPKSVESVDIEDVMPNGPDDALVARVVQYIDPSVLAAALKQGPVLFSSDPKPNEMPLAADSDALNTIASEQNLYTDFLKRLAANETADQDPLVSAADVADRRVVDPNSLRIVAQLTGDPANAQLNVELLDAKGQKYLPTTTTSLTNEDSDDYGVNPNAVETKDIVVKPLNLSPLGRDFVLRFGSMRKGSPTPPSPALLDALLDPESHDPLSYEVSDSLLGIAEQNGLQLVASPEEIQAGMNYLPAPQAAPNKAALLLDPSISITVKDGWLLYQPADTLEAENERVDRRSLANFLHAVEERHFASIDDMADYEAANRGDTAMFVANIWRNLIHPGSRGPYGQDEDGLRLWGSLDADERQRLLAGQKVRIAEVGDSAARAALQAVNDAAEVDAADKLYVPEKLASTDSANDTLEDVFGEVLQGSLALHRQSTWAVQIRRPTAARPVLVSIDRAAHMLSSKGPQPDWKFAFGTGEEYDLDIERRSGTTRLAVHEYHNDLSEEGTYDELPAELRKELEAAIARVKAEEATEQVKQQDQDAPDQPETPPPF